MDAHEAGRVEQGFERGDGLLLQIALALAVERDVVVLGVHVIQPGDGNHVHSRAVLDDDAQRALAGGAGLGRKIGRRAAFAQAGTRAVEGTLETFGAEGLEQVVHGVGVEGAHRVLVVGGDEDDYRGLRGLDQFEHFEAIELRHLNVEEEQVRGGFGDGLDGFESVGAFGHDLEFQECGASSSRRYPRASSSSSTRTAFNVRSITFSATVRSLLKLSD